MESGTDRITELAAIISQNTERISTYLNAHDLPPLSFAADAPPGLPEVLGSARAAVVEAADELKLLVQGPKEALQSEGVRFPFFRDCGTECTEMFVREADLSPTALPRSSSTISSACTSSWTTASPDPSPSGRKRRLRTSAGRAGSGSERSVGCSAMP